MEEVVIGSAAVEISHGNILGRKAKDWDVLSLERPHGFADWIDGKGILDSYSFPSGFASLDEVYSLKVSHSPWVINGLSSWHKHIRDIRILKDNGAVMVQELHDVAYREWESRHGKKTINLSQEKEKFFNNSVERFFDHDSVHAAVSLGEKPAFNRILKQEGGVAVAREKFLPLSEPTKRRLVFEETMVLSLERDLIPASMAGKEIGKLEIFESYGKQLRLLITQYSKGWWTQWIIENYFDVAAPPLDYWRLFQSSNKKIAL